MLLMVARGWLSDGSWLMLNDAWTLRMIEQWVAHDWLIVNDSWQLINFSRPWLVDGSWWFNKFQTTADTSQHSRIHHQSSWPPGHLVNCVYCTIINPEESKASLTVIGHTLMHANGYVCTWFVSFHDHSSGYKQGHFANWPTNKSWRECLIVRRTHCHRPGPLGLISDKSPAIHG